MEGTELGRLQGSATLGALGSGRRESPSVSCGRHNHLFLQVLGEGRQEPRVLSVRFFFFSVSHQKPCKSCPSASPVHKCNPGLREVKCTGQGHSASCWSSLVGLPPQPELLTHIITSASVLSGFASLFTLESISPTRVPFHSEGHHSALPGTWQGVHPTRWIVAAPFLERRELCLVLAVEPPGARPGPSVLCCCRTRLPPRLEQMCRNLGSSPWSPPARERLHEW